MLSWTGRAGRPPQQAAFAVTDRLGGVSRPPYDRLNLATHVGDDPDDVALNRSTLAGALGVPASRLLFLEQVHGRDVVQADGPWPAAAPRADAAVSVRRDLVLAVLVADCPPVLLADPDAGVVGVAHAGRQGLAAGVVDAVVDAMCDLGARRISARVGPSVCGRCYEVPTAMRAEIAASVPAAWSVTRRGTASLDIAAGVVARLAARSVQVQWLDGCTVEREDLFSHRRDGVCGRFAGVAWLPS